MSKSTDILKSAISRRLSSYSRDIVIHSCLGVLSVLAGSGLFVFLWINYRSDETELVSQLAGGSTSLITVGLAGFLVTKVFSVREQIREGREWLDLYNDALGPPPDELVSDIKGKILNWLEGT